MKITVDQDAVDGDLANDKGQGDHYLEHRGPVGPIPQGEWGDIIPPITGVHAGYNWTTEGQAIYNAGCTIVDTTTTSTVVDDTTTTTVDTTTTTGVDATTTTEVDTTTTTGVDATTTTEVDATTTTGVDATTTTGVDATTTTGVDATTTTGVDATTTTEVDATTTTGVDATTTTVEVLNETTIRKPEDDAKSTTSTSKLAVLGTSTTRTAATGLAVTGGSNGLMLFVGFAMIVFGAVAARLGARD